MTLRFGFNERKAIEALTYIADHWPGITPFFASKVLFFAEKRHLNAYARPIVADTFIAMANGPVPSTIYDFIQGRLDLAGEPRTFIDALEIKHDKEVQIRARRKPDLQYLSETDRECLRDAVEFCRVRRFDVLSDITHHERAWREAPINGPMDYEAFIDEGPDREGIVEQAREFAVYGVL